MSAVYLVLLGALSFFTTADGHVTHYRATCRFSSKDMHDAEYLEGYYYNTVKIMEYNSTRNTFVGYTALGVHNADLCNKIPGYLAQLQANIEGYCKRNGANYYGAIYDKTVEPSVHLRSVTPEGSRHTAMLMCSAYKFYPKRIHITWKRDGQEVTSDVTSTWELGDGDWYHQIHSSLEYTPRAGEKISCMVEHASLSEPKELHWDPSMPESERNKLAIGASGLVLGLVLTAAGFLYYRKKRGSVL